jgi:glycosyltransferase involved in cell wall biosynthesis
VSNVPLVSIVTPSLNMGRFLEEAIQSVLGQDYPSMEYIVIDGGSTDETISILHRYRDSLRYEIGVDRGPAEAINKGIALSRGEIVAYLSADDAYLPGAVSAAVRALTQRPSLAGVYGDGWWVDVNGEILARYPVDDFEPELLAQQCFICQPASFLRRTAFESVNGLDTSLQFVYDYEFWMRLSRVSRLGRIPGFLAKSRMHSANRTLGQRREVFEETIEVLERHYGYVPFPWVYSYCAHRLDGRDQFYEPLQPSLTKYAYSLVDGLSRNWRHPFRYMLDWAGRMSWNGAMRQLRGVAWDPRRRETLKSPAD